MNKRKYEEKEILKKAAEESMKRYKEYEEKTVDDAFEAFEKELTLDTFYELCVILCQCGRYQVEDALHDYGYKIPLPELKKIIEFIENDGQDDKWDQCEFSVAGIVSSHIRSNSLANISQERLECLIPYLDDGCESFWNQLSDWGRMYRPSKMSAKDLQMVFKLLFKPKAKAKAK
ncbi:MAG: hypothetical protein ACTSUE_09880 [Promethearchaeota archaeon]